MNERLVAAMALRCWSFFSKAFKCSIACRVKRTCDKIYRPKMCF